MSTFWQNPKNIVGVVVLVIGVWLLFQLLPIIIKVGLVAVMAFFVYSLLKKRN